MTDTSSHLKRAILLSVFIVLSSVIMIFSVDADRLNAGTLSSLIWMTLVFYTLLLSALLFKEESEDGLIDQWVLLSEPLSNKVRADALRESVFLMICIVPSALLLAVLFSLELAEIGSLLLSILLGFPILVLFSFLGAAFTLKNTLGNALAPVVLLPLLVPVIVFGQKVSYLSILDPDIKQPILLLLGFGILLYSIMPPLIAFALKLTNGQE